MGKSVACVITRAATESTSQQLQSRKAESRSSRLPHKSTGDNALTAHAVAEQIGISGSVCSPEKLRGDLSGEALDCSVFAGVFPEDKIRLVRAFLKRGAVVGMSGDGINDTPALRQAEAGVAVASATDVAKAGARGAPSMTPRDLRIHLFRNHKHRDLEHLKPVEVQHQRTDRIRTGDAHEYPFIREQLWK